MNGRGVFVLAYADLDGDGFIGPTNADGSADNGIERQEIEVPAGRQVATIINGVAQGGLGVSLGAPGSIGVAVIAAGTGRTTENVVPLPGALSRTTRPPWRSIKRFTVARPMPVPFDLVVKKRSKMRSCCD